MVRLYIDGGCSGNDQKDMSKRVMVSLVTNEAGAVLSEITAIGGSNNIAELKAVLHALEWCHAHAIAEVTIYTDSRNNLSWVNGTKVGKQVNDRVLVLQLKQMIAELAATVRFRLEWIPREQNLAGHHLEAVGL